MFLKPNLYLGEDLGATKEAYLHTTASAKFCCLKHEKTGSIATSPGGDASKSFCQVALTVPE